MMITILKILIISIKLKMTEKILLDLNINGNNKDNNMQVTNPDNSIQKYFQKNFHHLRIFY